MRVTICLLLAALAVPPAALADARAVVVAGGTDGWSTDAVQARLGDSVELGVAIIDDDDVYADGPARIDGRSRRAVSALPDGATVRWLRVEPHLVHTSTPAPNPGIPSFSNAVLTGPRHGAWLGYDTLEYDTLPLAALDGVVIDGTHAQLSAAHPTLRSHDVNGGAGSIWLAAVVTLPDGRVLATPDGTSVDRYGLTRRVMRL